MKKPIGFGFAITTLASLAIAGGEGEQEKAKSGENTKAMEKMANTPASGGAAVDAAAGKGFTISVGDEFSLNVKNRVQVLWRYSDFENAQDTNNFSIRRARTALSGHVWDKDKTYLVQLDWARDGTSGQGGSGTDILLDAWFNWDFWRSEDAMNQIGIRFGQQKPHHGREFQGTSAALDHTERSLASNVFSGERVIGAWLHGDHMDNKLHWWGGVGNSDPAAASVATEGGSNGPANPDNEVNFLFDARFDPWGDYGDEKFEQGDLTGTEEIKGTVGASLLVGNHTGGVAAPNDTETTSINIYTGFKLNGIHVLGEAFIRSDDPDGGAAGEADSTGFAVDASYTLPPAEQGACQWSFAGRWSLVDLDDAPILLATPLGGSSGDINELSATITNYYKANALKSQLGYRYQQVDPDTGSSSDNHFLDVLFQFVF